ncbi:MAG: YraN family protein [Planctomycetota bacterium]|jgi:putative endonuclease
MKRLLRLLRGGGGGRGGRGGVLGEDGERLAARWLKRRGYRILHRGLRVGSDEADVVAVDPDGRTLVIVEVKTRAADAPGPEAGITRDKRFRLARLASRLQDRPRFRDHAIRFDAVAIVWPPDGDPEVRHYEDAFESPW